MVDRENLACGALENFNDPETKSRHAAPFCPIDSEGDMDLGVGQPAVVPDCDLSGKRSLQAIAMGKEVRFLKIRNPGRELRN